MTDVKLALVLACAALIVGATACGGDDSSSSDETTTEAATTPEPSGGGGSASATLTGETGPGFEISVSQDTVKAGTYTLDIEDKSEMHNFHLVGPGVDEEITDVPFVGEKSVTVTLEPGTYTFQCDPHVAQGMKGTFTVT